MTKNITPEDMARLREFLDNPWVAVVATVGRNGMPQLTPNWYSFTDGKLHISTRKQTVKYHNLSRQHKLAVCVCSEPRAQNYITLSGPAKVIEDDSIWAETRRIVQRYVAGPDAVEARMTILRNQDRVIVSLTPERVVLRY